MPKQTQAEIFKATIAKLMKILNLEPSRIYELLAEMEEFNQWRNDDQPYSDDF